MENYQVKAPIKRVLEVIEGFHQYQQIGHGSKLRYKRYEISENRINWNDDRNVSKIGDLYSGEDGLTVVCFEDSENPQIQEGQNIIRHLLSWIVRD